MPYRENAAPDEGAKKKERAPIAQWVAPQWSSYLWGEPKPWWSEQPIQLAHEGSTHAIVGSWVRDRLTAAALGAVGGRGELCVEDRRRRGLAESVDAVIDALVRSGGRVVMRDLPPSREEDDEDGGVRLRSLEEGVGRATLVGPHAAVQVSWGADYRHVNVFVVALGAGLADAILSSVPEGALVSEPPKAPAPRDARSIYALVSCMGDLSVKPVGRIDEPLCRANYPQAVLGAFDAAVENIGRQRPRGRLVLLSGPTGTGKTHLIRGLAHACTKAAFVMLDPDLVPGITKPNMIPVLLRLRDRNQETPIVFLVEDGDRAVAERQVENLDHVQALLNVGGGLAGDLLGVHVVVTTNARLTGSGALRIDPAIMRPRRMAVHAETSLLDPGHAAALYADIAGRPPPVGLFQAPTSLADVYHAAETTVAPQP